MTEIEVTLCTLNGYFGAELSTWETLKMDRYRRKPTDVNVAPERQEHGDLPTPWEPPT